MQAISRPIHPVDPHATQMRKNHTKIIKIAPGRDHRLHPKSPMITQSAPEPLLERH
jgi:hypothetical protein